MHFARKVLSIIRWVAVAAFVFSFGLSMLGSGNGSSAIAFAESPSPSVYCFPYSSCPSTNCSGHLVGQFIQCCSSSSEPGVLCGEFIDLTTGGDCWLPSCPC